MNVVKNWKSNFRTVKLLVRLNIISAKLICAAVKYEDCLFSFP